MPTIFRITMFAVFVSFFGAPVWAQTGGTVTGSVADETGGVLPGVSVSLMREGADAGGDRH